MEEMAIIAWHDLRDTCTICDERADFSVTYTSNSLLGGTIIKGYCLHHLPKEVTMNKLQMIEAAQQPPGT